MASRNMIMKWFDRHRGLASGISGAAVAFGFSYAPSVFSKMIDRHGWAGAWFLMGVVLILIFAPLLLIFFRDNPEASGLIPDGKTLPSKEWKSGETERPFTLAEARRTFAFWAFSLTMALQALIITAVTFNIESIFQMSGMEGSAGFALFPPTARISVAVTLMGGWLSDHVQLRWFLAAMLLAMAGNLVGLIFLASGWPIACIIVCSGIANGLFAILMSITWPRYYGRKHLGAISGLCMTLMVVFSAVGPVLFSGILKISGKYTGGSLICLLATLALFTTAFRARKPQQR